MKKRIFSSLLAVAMAATMIAGCGATDTTSTSSTDSSSTTSSSSTESSSTDAGTSDASGLVKVRVMRDCFNLGTTSEERTKEVQDAINAYIADKIGVEIELTDIDNGSYADKANLAIANNEVDLLWTAAWMGTVGTKDLFRANAAKDITDLLPGTALYDSMDANTWEATKYDGRNYFIPVYKDNVEGYNFMFRTAFLDEAGIDVSNVKTLADLEPVLVAAKDAGLKYPFLTQKTAMFYRWYIDSFDFFTGDSTSDWVAVDRDTNEVVNTIATDEYKEFVTLIAKWADAGYISEEEAQKATSEQATSSQDWAVSWWTDIPNNGEAKGRYSQDVTMVKATKNYLHTDSALGSCYAIAASASDEATKGAIDFMGLLYTDTKLADLYTYGIEGTDFNYDDNGYVAKVADATYNHSMWESANATVVTCEAENPYTPEMYKDFNGSAVISCANGFQFDKGPVEDKYAACQNVFETYGFMLENGGVAEADVEATLADYQKALDDAGYQDVLAEFQKQYNEWK
ncbi:MAG: ABC transporter substrate-binding protein [Lachnospiraceae bacterium]|nr:ABC transporter substrate-binding protein [Lachnospiraceae bacterium]